MATATVTDLPTSTPSLQPDFESGHIPFWWTRTGVIVKWSLFLGLFLFIGLYLFFGHRHARNRIRKGLPPLGYHRWLVGRTELARVDPRYAYATQPGGYNTYRPDYYGMQNMPAPPPVYDPNAPRPPVYDGPDGGSKVAPSQWTSQPAHQPEHEEFQAPPGPPPTAAVTANNTGASNNPYRQ